MPTRMTRQFNEKNKVLSTNGSHTPNSWSIKPEDIKVNLRDLESGNGFLGQQKQSINQRQNKNLELPQNKNICVSKDITK